MFCVVTIHMHTNSSAFLTDIVSLYGVEITVDRIVTKDDKHGGVVDDVRRVTDGRQRLTAVDRYQLLPCRIILSRVQSPKFICYCIANYSAVHIDDALCTHTFENKTTWVQTNHIPILIFQNVFKDAILELLVIHLALYFVRI